MKVSIITVSYNSVATIRHTIESVMAQTYSDVEYIVIDGGSSDGTLDIVSEYSSYISCLVSEPDQGIYEAMNKGIRIASGDVIGILNSDDFYEDSKAIESIVKGFDRAPSCDLVFGDIVFVRPDDLGRIVRFYCARSFSPWKLRFGWMPPHPGTFIRRDAYTRVGFYSLDYKIAADHDMFVRLLLTHGSKACRLNRVLVRMRTGGVSTSGIRNSIQLNREIVRACRSNGIYTNLFFVLLKIPFKLMELKKKPSTAA